MWPPRAISVLCLTGCTKKSTRTYEAKGCGDEICLVDVSNGVRRRVHHCVPAMSEGLRIEAAAGIVARDQITKHLTLFGPAVRGDRITAKSVVAAYIDGLAGAVALTIAGAHAAKDEVIEITVDDLRRAIERDLRHLRAG